MQNLSADSITETKTVDFGLVPIDTITEKIILIQNLTDLHLTYRVSLMYILDNIDQVFKVSVNSTPVKPLDWAEVKIVFKPKSTHQFYTDYYIIGDTSGNTYRLNLKGKCFGPKISISKKQLVFRVVKNVSEQRTDVVNIVNKSSIDATYQWLLPACGAVGFFQISTGNCGVIRAFESIATTIIFSATALGVYTTELICLVLNQEPLYLTVLASVVLPGTPFYDLKNHIFQKYWKRKSRSAHLMENSLNRLTYIPSASVYEKYLDFGSGSVVDNTFNISQTLCVTNHELQEGSITWIQDPDNVFLIDPITCDIPPNESKLFTIRFRPKLDNEALGYLLCGDFQFESYEDESEYVTIKHTWYRIPCIGNTWLPCAEWSAEWDCPTEVVLPPTVPARTTFTNFLLSNKSGIPMHFKFGAPYKTNFVVMPMCGVVQGRGWQIVTVALEPISFGEYCENWDLVINKSQTARICLIGSAEVSQVEMMSHGYNPDTHAVYEFPPTITGCTNYCTAFLHNLTRMEIHMRVLSNVSWLGGDDFGSIVLPPKEIVRYHWWFFPKEHDKVYETTVVCSCICLIGGKPVGQPTELFIQITGFSELPNLKVHAVSHKAGWTEGTTIKTLPFSIRVEWRNSALPFLLPEGEIIIILRDSFPQIEIKPVGLTGNAMIVLPRTFNLHDTVVGEKASTTITLYNFGSCYFTSKLYHVINGMGDDYSGDKFEIESSVNSLKPSHYCEVKMTVIANGAGSRQIDIKYTVLYRTEYDEIEEIQPIKKTILIIWYNGIYPTIKVKRTISVRCPITLSDHCVWNIVNVEEFNKKLQDCRPNTPLVVNLHAPDLCVRPNDVELVFVLACLYNVPVPFSFRREKICDCIMSEVQVGISTFEMRHTCYHRQLVDLSPMNGIVAPDTPVLLHIKFKYAYEARHKLCFVMTMPNQRTLEIFVNLNTCTNSIGFLTPLRRNVGVDDYLTVLDCGRVPINNLDPVTRILWLYNPTEVFATWRLLRGNTGAPETVIRCLQYFAEVPPMEKIALPFAFMPTEMIDYEVMFYCSFGYDIVKILVKGQGGLPNCVETRLDIQLYVEKLVRSVYKNDIVYLSKEHMTLPIMPTHSLIREIIAINNDTDHVLRFIWMPERIPNIVNVVMTPWWGVIQPKSSEWITITVYTLQEPATFTTTITCEILDLTERKRYQKNEILRRTKTEKCKQEFIITEEGLTHPHINDCPPFVLDLKKPQPSYVAMSLSVSSKGQRDGYPRMLLKQMWEQPPQYDLLSSDGNNYGPRPEIYGGNNMTRADVIKIIDGILWDALHSKMFRTQIEYYATEDIPTYDYLVNVIESDSRPKLSKRVTSGICDAIVNKAIFHVYNLNPKYETAILEAE